MVIQCIYALVYIVSARCTCSVPVFFTLWFIDLHTCMHVKLKSNSHVHAIDSLALLLSFIDIHVYVIQFLCSIWNILFWYMYIYIYSILFMQLYSSSIFGVCNNIIHEHVILPDGYVFLEGFKEPQPQFPGSWL